MDLSQIKYYNCYYKKHYANKYFEEEVNKLILSLVIFTLVTIVCKKNETILKKL